MRPYLTIVLLLLQLLLQLGLLAQPDPSRIQIARDAWGIPHIFAPTDAGVAYGLAWATAEDDFRSIQLQLLAVKGQLGLAIGKEGAVFDVAMHLLGADSLVEARYAQDLSPEFRRVVEGYAAGLNAFARTHPERVMRKQAFPVRGQDLIKAYVVGVAQMAGVDRLLRRMLNGELEVPAPLPRGSNGLAVSRRRTTDGKTYLAINSHQPLEGPTAWYEAHLCSEQGWNMLGANFPGGVSLFIGANEYLGWTHTVNSPDLADVYQLEMHPNKKHFYRYDGQWRKLRPFHTKARIKLLGFLRFGLKQKFYQSAYGLTLKTDQGVFALRFPANRDIRVAEQWYRMNKARNFEEFQQALRMQALASLNIVYADRDDHIYYLGNGRFPRRDTAYDWEGVLPGDTSATCWSDRYYPLDSLPQVLDPASGFVFNCNQTPFLASGAADNPDPSAVPRTAGFQPPERINNRSTRLQALMEQAPTLSYAHFKRIKFDQAYHAPLASAPKLEALFALDSTRYPSLALSLAHLQSWDRVMDTKSEAASLFRLVLHYLRTCVQPISYQEGDELNEALLVEALEAAQQHLITHFGRLDVPLGELQRHVRGEVDLPVGGGPDVLAAMHSRPMSDGRFRARAGESYISLVRFSENGPEIEAVNAYGTSTDPESPHYTDQMELYTRQQLRPMSLDKETVLKAARRVYHPR